MAGISQPLLADQELQSAWDDPDLESEDAERISSRCTVAKMFEEHPHDVLRHLQTAGVEKLGEFTADDDIVFAAFGDNMLLTFGSDKRWIDAEAEWRRRLATTAKFNAQTNSAAADLYSHHLQSKKGWSNNVSLEAFVVTIKDAAGSLDQGLLHPLIKQWQSNRCSFAVFSLPAVQSVITFKWKAFARKLLLSELILYCTWLISFYVFCAAMQGEDLGLTLYQLLATSQGRLTVIAEVISLAAMTPFLLLEGGSILAYGAGWLRDPTNALDSATYVLQILISVLHFGRFMLASNWLTYCLAVQCILLMFRLQYFTQVLRPTRFSFTAVIKEVLKETFWVFIFIFLTCIAYGAAFHITFRSEKKSPDQFRTFTRSVLTAFENLYGDLKLDDFLGVKNSDPIFATGLAMSFILIMGYCLINLLIGMIITSVDRVLAHEGAKQLCHQALVINELESILPRWFEECHKGDWHPAYVHILRINPKKLDAIQLDKLWSKHGESAPVMTQGNGSSGEAEGDDGGGGGGGNGDKKEILEKLDKVERKLEKLLLLMNMNMEESAAETSGDDGAVM